MVFILLLNPAICPLSIAVVSLPLIRMLNVTMPIDPFETWGKC